jgi:ABC-type transporter Mla MlaB component
MLRISVEKSSGGLNETLYLEGHLVAKWVQELSFSCDQALRESKRLTLDLSTVSFVDRDGIALLRKLKACEVAITNCSAFVAHQIKDRRSGI